MQGTMSLKKKCKYIGRFKKTVLTLLKDTLFLLYSIRLNKRNFETLGISIANMKIEVFLSITP